MMIFEWQFNVGKGYMAIANKLKEEVNIIGFRGSDVKSSAALF